MRVKICGITNSKDAFHAVDAGADALGFVFYPESPRYIEPDNAGKIIAQLPPFVSCVGLFVNAHSTTINDTIKRCNLDTVQLHGDETEQQCCYPQVKVIKAVRVRSTEQAATLPQYPVAALLVDAWVKNVYGGTGEVGNWSAAAQLAQQRPVILAGGLNAGNVAAAIAEVKPFAVDVSSGVELSPGIKDGQKVTAFIAAAKQSWR